MAFEAWESFNDDLMELPWNGHVYRISPMRADVGAWLKAVDPKSKTNIKTPLSKMTDVEQARAILGDAYDEMVADGAPDRMVARAVDAAIADWLMGRGAAEIVWRDGVADPKAVGQKIAQILTQSTDAADETPAPASMSGMSSPRPRKPRTRKSPGRPSLKSGS